VIRQPVIDVRRRQVATGLAMALAGLNGAVASASASTPASASSDRDGWPAWQRFDRRFLGSGTRVIDPAASDQRTTSEGQAYALFFCLVANQAARFESILRWTEDALCQGDLILHLPAWLWGQRDDGTLGVIDTNTASDADLWMTYTLAEAGRVWNNRRYTALAMRVAARILAEETATIPGLGPTLLPGKVGFVLPGRWRVNPSYAPLFVLRRLAAVTGEPTWSALEQSQALLLKRTAPMGWSPDWASWPDEASASAATPVRAQDERLGSYDAIRVYLWLALDAPGDPKRSELLQHFQPVLSWMVSGKAPPERVDVQSGGQMAAEDQPPPGFFAVMEAFCRAAGAQSAADRLATVRRQAGEELPGYYDQALGLFADAAMEGRIRVDVDGRLGLRWQRGGA
jgi:endoglucanase